MPFADKDFISKEKHELDYVLRKWNKRATLENRGRFCGEERTEGAGCLKGGEEAVAPARSGSARVARAISPSGWPEGPPAAASRSQ